jgi:uncharacterized UBP type Zn finger protein
MPASSVVSLFSCSLRGVARVRGTAEEIDWAFVVFEELGHLECFRVINGQDAACHDTAGSHYDNRNHAVELELRSYGSGNAGISCVCEK